MLAQLGVKGYTVQAASGSGERGIRAVNELGAIHKNVRIDVITNEKMAHQVANKIFETFFKNYAGIVYLQDVEVIQTQKIQGH